MRKKNPYISPSSEVELLCLEETLLQASITLPNIGEEDMDWGDPMSILQFNGLI